MTEKETVGTPTENKVVKEVKTKTFTQKPREETKDVSGNIDVREASADVEAVEEVAVKPKPTQFVMVKNFSGSMVVELEAHDFSTPIRRIRFRHDEERKYIPAKWAVGTFVTDSSTRMMEKGYFTFENLGVLIEMAEEMGYYVPDLIKEPKVTLKEIAKALRTSDTKELEKITEMMSDKTRRDIIASAKKLYGSLNMEVINLLEKKLKVSLKPINLND